MPTFRYFAYGSNMLAERLQARCPSARVVGAAVIRGGYELVFTKRSVDGSGKAALVDAQRDRSARDIYGVVYDIELGERDLLDRCEGDGYLRHDEVTATVLAGAAVISATTYFANATRIEPGLQPYDWYMALTIAGAKQNALPQAYIGWLQDMPAVADPDADRPRRLEALRLLDHVSPA